MDYTEKRRGCQTIVGKDGQVLFNGGWDSLNLFKAVTGEDETY